MNVADTFGIFLVADYRACVRRSGRERSGCSPRDMESVFAESIQRPRLLSQLWVSLPGSRCCSPPLASTECLLYIRWSDAARLASAGAGAERLSVVAQVMKQGLLLITGGAVGLEVYLISNRLIASPCSAYNQQTPQR